MSIRPLDHRIGIVIAFVMQRNTVELLERIRNLASRSLQSRIQRNAFHLACNNPKPLVRSPGMVSTHIDTVAFFHIAEVDSIDASALIRNDWWFRVSEEGPRGLPEEGVSLDVRGTCAGSKPAKFVLDEKFADERLAEAGTQNLARTISASCVEHSL